MLPYTSIINLQHYINNNFENGLDSKTLKVVNKYNDTEIAEITLANQNQVINAINAAKQGFINYKAWSSGKKSEAIVQIKNELIKQHELFAQLISAEAGKPISYARTEVTRAITTLDIAAYEALKIHGEVVPIDFSIGAGKNAIVNRFPIGVVSCITPFNFPLNLAIHKIAPALAAGCSFILKPPLQAPLTCLAFAKLIQQAGFPSGVANVLVCENNNAEHLVTNPNIALLSFTGSAAVGWKLKNICGKKKVTLELGGNAAVIIDESADLNYAAKQIATGCFLYAGQICIKTQRIFVLKSIANEFTNILLHEISLIKSGNNLNNDVINSSLISKNDLLRIDDWVKEAINLGAKVLAGGKILFEENNIYEPTLLTNTNNLMKVVEEEIFGPVAIIETVESFSNAINAVNNSKYGLQAGVFTNQFNHVKQAHQELEVGGIIINNIPGFRMDNMPYGGIKESGLGREGVKYAIEDMTEPRLMVY